MKIKQTLNTAWLLLFACTNLALVHCSKEDDPEPEPISDEAAVMQAKDNLEIGYADGDSAEWRDNISNTTHDRSKWS